MASNCCHYHHNNTTNTAACLKRMELCTCKITIMGSSSWIHTVGSMTNQPDKWVNLVNESMRIRPSQWVTINDLSTVNVHKAHCPMATPLNITASKSVTLRGTTNTDCKQELVRLCWTIYKAFEWWCISPEFIKMETIIMCGTVIHLGISLAI